MSQLIPPTMRALVYRGKDDLRVEQLETPRIKAGELLVRVAVCGVCPTDIKKIKYGTLPPPRVFGHETAGVVVKKGALVRGFEVGDRVGLHHHIPCLNCHACRHQTYAQCLGYKKTGITAGFEPAGGGYGEYVRVMPFVLPGVVKIPKKNTLDEGAMLEPINTVLKAVRRLSLLKGDRVLVIGQGPIGLMFTGLLRLEGAVVIATDLVDAKLRMAKSFGANQALNPVGEGFARFLDQNQGSRGVDAVVVAVPLDQAVHQAFTVLRPGGKVLLFAHTRRGDESRVDFSSICVDEKDLIGSYSADVTLQKEVARVVFSRMLDVKRLITHRYPLEQGKDAVELAAKPTETSLKIVVDVGESSWRQSLR